MLHCRVGGRRPNYRKTLQNLKDLMEQYFLSFYEIENIQDIIHEKKKETIPVSIDRSQYD